MLSKIKKFNFFFLNFFQIIITLGSTPQLRAIQIAIVNTYLTHLFALWKWMNHSFPHAMRAAQIIITRTRLK